MRIVQVVHGYPPRYNAGSEVYTQTLSRSLANRHQVMVFTRFEDPFLPPYAEKDELDAGDPGIPPIPLRLINIPHFRDRYRHQAVDESFARCLDDFTPEIVHIQHLGHLSSSLVKQASLRSIPVVFTLHDFWLMCPRGQFLQFFPTNPDDPFALCDGQEDRKCATHCCARHFSGAPDDEPEDVRYYTEWIRRRMQHMREIISLVDMFITPSKQLRRRFVEEFSLPFRRVEHLDYGFDLKRLSGRQRAPRAGGGFVFGYIGTHVPAKGIHQLLDAFARLNDNGRLRIWGRPHAETTPALMQIHNRLPASVRQRISWEGEYANEDIVRAVFNQVDAIVVPSIWLENSPLVIHEAQQARVPVITATAGGMAELVHHEVNGLLFEHRNPASLAGQMSRLLNDPALATRLGERGYLHDPEGNVPSTEQLALKIEALYTRLFSPNLEVRQEVRSPSRDDSQAELNLNTNYPKRLIEVDLPIKRISAHARREKSIRHGHISTLHIWWARRPLAACRAVICAALWPDPAAPDCPVAFREKAREEMLVWTSHDRQKLLSAESCKRFEAARQNPKEFDDAMELRGALLDFIADFASWYNSTVPEYLETSRSLTQAAHEALGGAPGTRPLVVDTFAGGGSIPLEALRVGAEAFASDLNPVAVLLNKVVLEYIPKYGQRLADEVRKWGELIKHEAETELEEFYPKDSDGATPIAYLWARTIQCEGPGCGAEVPLIRSLWLAKKTNRSVALQLHPNPKSKRVDFQIILKERYGWVDQDNPKAIIENPKFLETVKRGSATCPCCGYTTPVARVRAQLKTRRGGANNSRMLCVACLSPKAGGRSYRLPNEADFEAIQKAVAELQRRNTTHSGNVSLIPDELLDSRGIRHTWAMIYGFENQGDFFSSRQMLALTTLTRLVNEAGAKLRTEHDSEFASAVQTGLAFAVSKESDLTNSLCSWKPDAECPVHMMARQAIPMLWDFTEAVATCESSGSWSSMIERTAHAISSGVMPIEWTGTAIQCSAAEHALPSNTANAFITDPPYYDAVPYAYLSDFFYVWLRRSLKSVHEDLFKQAVVPKDEEIVVDRPHELSDSNHNIAFYERELTKAFSEGRRLLRSDGVATIVFASKTTASWEAILKAVIDAGWIVTGSWPIDTEMETRVSAQGQARLASSVHLVCRPRENVDGILRNDEIGDWRDVLQELPRRIHEWMPRLAEEGVVGADAIFACLGPALEIFSRYKRVEKASGERVTLTDYLESVWAAVANEALATVLGTTDAQGFEPDARLTVIWLWVAVAGKSENPLTDEEAPDSSEDEIIVDLPKTPASGIVMEYDAARKLAQGMGVHLEEMSGPGGILTVSGKQASLNRVSLRESFLFSSQQSLFDSDEHMSLKQPRMPIDPKATLRSVSGREADLFDRPSSRNPEDPNQLPLPTLNPKLERKPLLERLAGSGSTTLDRLHQAMLLFSRDQVSLLSRFFEVTGAGQDQRFWRLAQALSALYPSQTEEKRWVDGVLARKKGLGF